MFRCLVLYFSCSRIVPMIFHYVCSRYCFLGVLIIFNDYFLSSQFAKLAYLDWSELEINRYAILLLKILDLVFLFFYTPIVLLNSSRLSTYLPSMSLLTCTSKKSLPCFRRLKYYKRLSFYLCFILTTSLQDSVIYANGYFDRYGSCINILIDLNISMGLSCMFSS